MYIVSILCNIVNINIPKRSLKFYLDSIQIVQFAPLQAKHVRTNWKLAQTCILNNIKLSLNLYIRNYITVITICNYQYNV